MLQFKLNNKIVKLIGLRSQHNVECRYSVICDCQSLSSLSSQFMSKSLYADSQNMMYVTAFYLLEDMYHHSTKSMMIQNRGAQTK